MSDTHMWPSRAAIAELISRVDLLRTQIRSLSMTVSRQVHDFRGDEYRDVRDLLVAIVGELREIDPADLAMQLANLQQAADQADGGPLPVRAPGAHRRGGERTQAWVVGQAPHMERNRGAW